MPPSFRADEFFCLRGSGGPAAVSVARLMSSRVLLEIGHLPLSGAVAPSVFVGFFEIQQVGFHAQTSGIADQCARAADHAVAGDDDGDRVAVVGHAYRAAGRRAADLRRDLAVGAGLAIRDRPQGLPHGLLERSAGGRQREGELAARSCEVFGQLGRRLQEQGTGRLRRTRLRGVARSAPVAVFAAEEDAGDGFVRSRDAELSDGCFDEEHPFHIVSF